MDQSGAKTSNSDTDELSNAVEQRLRRIIDTIPTIIWRESPDGSVDFLNQRFHEYTGLTLEDGLGWGWLNALHPDDRAMEEWRTRLATGKPFEKEVRLRRADGEYCWFLIRTAPLRDEQRNIVKWYGVSIDIDDLKRAEEGLRSSEREQRHIAGQLDRERARLVEAQGVAKVGSWEAELQSSNVIWSEETHRIFETDSSRFQPTRPKFHEFIHPEDRVKVDAAFTASLDRRSPSTVEYRIVMPDGRVKNIEERWQAFLDEEGKPVRVAGTCREITDRVRAEEELRQAEERIRAILEYSPNWIFLKDTEGRYLLVNTEVERVFGRSQEQIKGKTDSEIFPPEQAAEYRANDLKVLHTGLTMEFEEIALLEDGPHTSIVHKFPLFDTYGNIFATGGVATDITERKRAEEALRRSEERYRLIVENQTEFIVKWLPDGTRTFVNENYCRTFGIAEADCLGTSFYPLVDPKYREEIKRKVAALAVGKPEFTEEHPSFLPDGKHWQQWTTRGIFDAGGNLIELLSAGRDITKLKQAEEELRQLSASLLRSQDEERRRIARDLHDSMGQDLVALATMLGQLRASIPASKRKSRRLLTDCKALADKCIRDVRTLSYVLHPPVLDEAGLDEAIRDYVDGFTKRSGIHVELEVPPHVGRMAPDIELVLFRIVQESLTNIQRHSGSQHAVIRIHRNSHLTLEISDPGRGFSATMQSGKDDAQLEVGVGIPSMQERVRLIGGRLDIDSSNHGTTVRVLIPLERNEREKAAHTGG